MTDVLARLTAALADRYRIERELGQGGMATVYLAEDVRHRRRVALKVLHPELSAVIGPERFLKEIELTASLQHPHILPLFDSGNADGQLFYVMPYVEGETLRGRLERDRQLPIPEALGLAREVADALQYAHDRGVVHRDIKPENILLQGGHALVADFGIALAVQHAGGQRMTQTGLSLGTPQYMAPEQAMGEKQVDARADVYALGVVTYEMLAGEPPFMGPNAQAIVARVLSERPRALDTIRDTVTPQVAAAVETALAKLPADRFQSVRGFADALAASDVGRPRPSAPAGPASRWRSIGVPALMLALGAAIGAWVVRSSSPARAAASVRPLRLTHSGQVGCAAISPDGREYAAITGGWSDETGCVGALVVRAMPAGVDQVLADSVTAGSAVRWSPNGSSLLLQASIGGHTGLRVVSRTGAGIRLLRTGEHGVYGFADDRTVFVADGALIRLFDAESGDQRDSLALSAGALPSGLAVHPTRQGWAMAYQAEDRFGIYLLNAAGAVTDSIGRQSKSVAWLGADRLVAVEQGYLGVADIVTYGVSGGGERFSGEPAVVWAGLPAVNEVSATASGDQVMLVRIGVTDEQQLFDLRGPAPRATHFTRSLNAYLGDPAFSPDGRYLAYTREDALGFNTYVLPTAGGPERAVTSDSAGRLLVTWTGERRLVNWAAGGAIAVLDIETGRVRNAGEVPAGRVFRGGWENRLFWVHRATGDLIETDSLGREVRTVKLPGGTRDVTGGASRGEPLAFTRDDSTWRVHRLLAGGSGWQSSPPVRRSLLPSAVIGVGTDGSLYFTRLTGGTEILRLPSLASATLERVATLPVHCYLGSVRISPDGAWAVCNVTSYDPDAWVLPMGAGR